MQQKQGKEFNDTLVKSIDETITDLLSEAVLKALYAHLEKVYSLTRDKVPYRLETLSSALEKTFGMRASRTISKAIARKFYTKLGLTFSDNPGGTLIEYVEEAKIKLGIGESQL